MENLPLVIWLLGWPLLINIESWVEFKLTGRKIEYNTTAVILLILVWVISIGNFRIYSEI